MGPKIVLIISLLHVCALGKSQCLPSVFEEEGSEESSTLLIEELRRYELTPLRINTCSLEELLDFPLFSNVQCSQLAYYRRKHGAIFSEKELLLIPSFCPELITRIEKYVDYSNAPPKKHVPRAVKLISGGKWKRAEEEALNHFTRVQGNPFHSKIHFDLSVQTEFLSSYNLIKQSQLKGGVRYKTYAEKPISYVAGCIKVDMGSDLIFRSHASFFNGGISNSGRIKTGLDASSSSFAPLKGAAVLYQRNKITLLAGAGQRNYRVKKDVSLSDSLLSKLDPYGYGHEENSEEVLLSQVLFATTQYTGAGIKLAYGFAASNFKKENPLGVPPKGHHVFNQALRFEYHFRAHVTKIDVANFKSKLGFMFRGEGLLLGMVNYRFQFLELQQGYLAPDGQIGQSGVLADPIRKMNVELDYQPEKKHHFWYAFQQRIFTYPKHGHKNVSHDNRHQVVWEMAVNETLRFQCRYRYKHQSEMAFKQGVPQDIHQLRIKAKVQLSDQLQIRSELECLKEKGEGESTSLQVGSTFIWRPNDCVFKLQFVAGQVGGYQSRLYVYEQSLSYQFDQIVLYRTGSVFVLTSSIPVFNKSILQLKYRQSLERFGDRSMRLQDIFYIQFIHRW